MHNYKRSLFTRLFFRGGRPILNPAHS